MGILAHLSETLIRDCVGTAWESQGHCVWLGSRQRSMLKPAANRPVQRTSHPYDPGGAHDALPIHAPGGPGVSAPDVAGGSGKGASLGLWPFRSPLGRREPCSAKATTTRSSSAGFDEALSCRDMLEPAPHQPSPIVRLCARLVAVRHRVAPHKPSREHCAIPVVPDVSSTR